MSDRSPNLEWYLEGDPVLNAIVRKDMLGDTSAIGIVTRDPRIIAMVEEVTTWPWPPLVSHKSAGHQFHKLAFLAELRVDLASFKKVEFLNQMQASMDRGLPRVPTNVPVHFGGSGTLQMAWSVCDAPLFIYSLSRCFDDFDGREGVATLRSMARDIGMPCTVSPELGKFRGPGRKDDPCPLACLYALKAIAQIDRKGNEAFAMSLTDTLLTLWEKSRERHPYMFFMGTDFRKLKLPFIWYDILSVADTLSYYPWVRDDERFMDMLSIIDSKKDANGRYTPESVWTSWKGWDFCQKKEPSRWLTFAVERLRKRAEGV